MLPHIAAQDAKPLTIAVSFTLGRHFETIEFVLLMATRHWSMSMVDRWLFPLRIEIIILAGALMFQENNYPLLMAR
jgi:hypothetical protein